jgi:hypothetical protein
VSATARISSVLKKAAPAPRGDFRAGAVGDCDCVLNQRYNGDAEAGFLLASIFFRSSPPAPGLSGADRTSSGFPQRRSANRCHPEHLPLFPVQSRRRRGTRGATASRQQPTRLVFVRLVGPTGRGERRRSNPGMPHSFNHCPNECDFAGDANWPRLPARPVLP